MASGGLRLLVKSNRAATTASVALGAAAPVALSLRPLMPSIDRVSATALAAPATWHIAEAPDADVNPWDACHALVRDGLGVAGGAVAMAEPDLEQKWVWTSPNRQAFGLTGNCDAAPSNSDVYAIGNTEYWFADEDHSQLDMARDGVSAPAGNRVRIAHLDTGYDPNHITKPKFLRTDLARNFVDADRPMDATDMPTALINPMFGHGTGTLGILAGNTIDNHLLGGAANLEIVPVRVANWVVLFRNSAIAQAFDYVHSLWDDGGKRVHVVTMSMGGIASAAWADAVNALYERGVFVVTAAGNNFGNLPTRYIVYPARFNRVIAACGVMADGRPYADLPIRKMAGCYGPGSKDATAMAGYTPNVPWAKFGCKDTVDRDGGGTSAATPQIAAAAALWLQKHKAAVDAYPEGWMRVEAVRKALVGTLRPPDARETGRVGKGLLRASDALGQAPPPASALARTAADSASFSLLRLLTGLGMAAVPSQGQQMLELEALQISQQSHDLESALEDFDPTKPDAGRSREAGRIIEALRSHPTASEALKAALGTGSARSTVALPQGGVPAHAALTSDQTARALAPEVPAPAARRLWVYARDPLSSTDMTAYDLNEVELAVRWEKNLMPGPVGEYLEVVDVDPPSGLAYAPIDLNDPRLLAQSGYRPTEGNPQFHQQMVYAVAMRTIGYFEKALGRMALWAPRYARIDGKTMARFVRRLRIYPHALREANAYYSPEKRALLFGYFRASEEGGDNLPGGLVFNCLSHDIVAHETTHALLDGLHPRYKEPTSLDMLAFHEAFADIVALFQHFTMPEVLRAAIRRSKGHAGLSNELAGLAVQFGQAIGQHGALRDAIKVPPTRNDYQSANEAHARGAVLVAAIFSAFRRVYDRKTKDLFRLASGGTGILPEGDIPYDLVKRLADEAAEVAGNILEICIRALDYCPPVDLTFGEYLRALITADHDLIPDDDDGYRVAFVSAFRERGIFPGSVLNLSVDALTWQRPEFAPDALAEVIADIHVDWRRTKDRREAFTKWNEAARELHDRMVRPQPPDQELPDSVFTALGLFKTEQPRKMVIEGMPGVISRIEIHSIRPARRISPRGEIRSELIIEMTQKWQPDGASQSFRGGCTIVCDFDNGHIRYVIRKRVGNAERMKDEQGFRQGMAGEPSAAAFFEAAAGGVEPFAMLHRGI
jgi:hypothetical protein